MQGKTAGDRRGKKLRTVLVASIRYPRVPPHIPASDTKNKKNVCNLLDNVLSEITLVYYTMDNAGHDTTLSTTFIHTTPLSSLKVFTELFKRSA